MASMDWSNSFRPESRTPGVDCRGRLWIESNRIESNRFLFCRIAHHYCIRRRWCVQSFDEARHVNKHYRDSGCWTLISLDTAVAASVRHSVKCKQTAFHWRTLIHAYCYPCSTTSSANSVHCVHCGQTNCNTSLPRAGEVITDHYRSNMHHHVVFEIHLPIYFANLFATISAWDVRDGIFDNLLLTYSLHAECTCQRNWGNRSVSDAVIERKTRRLSHSQVRLHKSDAVV